MKCEMLMLGVVLLVGCQFDPYYDQYLTQSPKAEQVVGEYRLTEIHMEEYEPGIQAKVDALASSPRIVLSQDGSFEAFGFPFFDQSHVFQGFRHISGRWKIERTGSIGNGNGGSTDTFGLRIDDGLPLYLALPEFIGAKTVNGLLFHGGDPDCGEVIIYKKTE
jgi:hypothetical protein